MWSVKGKTVAGKDVEYKVPAGKDTDKAFVLALAFQQHGQTDASDPLTAEASVEWTSDSIMALPNAVVLKESKNFAVDRRVAKGVWERHSQRAYRSLEAAEEAMESAASEYPGDRFRIVETFTASTVISATKNSMDVIEEKPDEPKEETKSTEGVKADESKPADKPAPKGKPAPKAA